MRLCPLSTLVLMFCAVACFEDPIFNDSDDGDAQTDSGDGDGDSGDGDGDPGDGDGDPGENVVVDLFSEACGLTVNWARQGLLLMPTAIPCDEIGTSLTGWMVRYPDLMVGDVSFSKVISVVTGPEPGAEIRGVYNLDDVPGAETLEFRAEVLVVCGDADSDCVARFAVAIAEDVQDGLLTELEDRDLGSGMEPLSIAVSLADLLTLSEPSIVLIAERTEPVLQPSPELLIVNPRLVLP